MQANYFRSAPIWKAVALVAIAVGIALVAYIWYVSDSFTVVNAGNGRIYKVNRRTGKSWLLRGTEEIPVNQLTREQEAARLRRQSEMELAVKEADLAAAEIMQRAEAEQAEAQRESDRQRREDELAQLREEQQREQQERVQKLAVQNRERAIDMAKRSTVLTEALPDPTDPKHVYYRPDTNITTIREELESKSDVKIEGWAAQKVGDEMYLVSCTYLKGPEASNVREGYYFEVNLNANTVRNIFRESRLFEQYTSYGINPVYEEP
jgi:hypothetical protein